MGRDRERIRKQQGEKRVRKTRQETNAIIAGAGVGAIDSQAGGHALREDKSR